MQNAKMSKMLAIVLFASLFFSATTSAKAAELNIPPSTQIAGLTFDTPFNLRQNQDLIILKDLRVAKSDTVFLTSKPVTAPNLAAMTATTSATPSSELEPTAPPAPSPLPKPKIIVAKTAEASASSTPIEKPTSPLTSSGPTATPTPATPTQTPLKLSNGGLNADVLFDMVQSHRQAINLPAFQKDDRACKLAVDRAPEIDHEIASGTMHKGMYSRNLPYWNTENIITMNTEKGAYNWWIHDYIHKKQIEGDYKYSCLACSGNACAEEFTNFQPK